MANQLVGKFNCQQLSHLLQDPTLVFYCFVDSVDNARFLGEFFAEQQQQVNLLLEIGVPDGRCGWRELDNIAPLVEAISSYSSLNLAGISFYEGVIHGEDAEEKIVSFIDQIKTAI